MVRGLPVGLLTWGVAALFTGVSLAHAPAVLFFLLLASYVFSMLGLLAALWAEKFEQVNFFPTFVMLPLTFLGGVFYSVKELPRPWSTVSLFNPVVYMVEGLRYGMLGRSRLQPGARRGHPARARGGGHRRGLDAPALGLQAQGLAGHGQRGALGGRPAQVEDGAAVAPTICSTCTPRAPAQRRPCSRMPRTKPGRRTTFTYTSK